MQRENLNTGRENQFIGKRVTGIKQKIIPTWWPWLLASWD
jgi:hypothetical protein